MTKIQVEINNELNSKLEQIKDNIGISKTAAIRNILEHISSKSIKELYDIIGFMYLDEFATEAPSEPTSKYLSLSTKQPITPGPDSKLVDQYANEIDDDYTGQVYVI